MDISRFLSETSAAVEAVLGDILPGTGGYSAPLGEAMRYSALGGGKRLRPALAIGAADALGGERERVMPVAAALEMIHTYSLIHDDLPAMDDDTYRRGKLTSHRMFNEGVAILAGDALLTQAFQVLGEAPGIPERDRLMIVVEVAAACGPEGLIGGQMADLNAEGETVDRGALEYIHTRKTGALIHAAVRCGGIAAGGEGSALRRLSAYGKRVGLGFQIIDDILDVEGDPEQTGKATGRDDRRGKATYPALFGLDASRRRARELIEGALAVLEDFGPEADHLRGLALFIEQRSR